MAINPKKYVSIGRTGETTMDMNKYQLKANMTDNPAETSATKYPSSKALSDGLATKQGVLTAGTGITIEDNVISATGGSGGSLTKINNYTGFQVSDFILSIPVPEEAYENRLYFTPKDSIKDIFSADSWSIKLRFKYLGKSANATFATMGVAPLTDSVNCQGFRFGVDSNHICLKLSSNGTSWNIADLEYSYDWLGYWDFTEGNTYQLKLEFTGSGYYLYWRNENGNIWNLIYYVTSSEKISTSNNNSATIIISNDSSTDYDNQVYADWYLKDCYVKINNIYYNFTYEYNNEDELDLVDLADNVYIAGGKKYTSETMTAYTAITIESCEDSNKLSIIIIPTDSDWEGITDNSGISWVVGSLASMQPNKTYVIYIKNKLGFIYEK